jgi:hypothetical protein
VSIKRDKPYIYMQVKDLAKKVDSIDRGTLASSAHQSRMDPLTKKKKVDLL